MKYYGINAVAHELRVHQSSLRRWEENDMIFPERVDMGKTTLRIYDEYTVQVLRLAKKLMGDGINLREAFDRAYYELAHEEDD
jgi:MerR family transcriptional regulator, heat shock protein HspR